MYVNGSQSYSNATVVVYVTSHVCDLMFGIVEYKIELVGEQVKLRSISEDKFVRNVYV